jgi:hypothetical protein
VPGDKPREAANHASDDSTEIDILLKIHKPLNYADASETHPSCSLHLVNAAKVAALLEGAAHTDFIKNVGASFVTILKVYQSGKFSICQSRPGKYLIFV